MLGSLKLHLGFHRGLNSHTMESVCLTEITVSSLLSNMSKFWTHFMLKWLPRPNCKNKQSQGKIWGCFFFFLFFHFFHSSEKHLQEISTVVYRLKLPLDWDFSGLLRSLLVARYEMVRQRPDRFRRWVLLSRSKKISTWWPLSSKHWPLSVRSSRTFHASFFSRLNKCNVRVLEAH